MGWTLRPDVSFCVAEGRACFLDLASDRYFALGENADAAFRHLLDGKRLSRWHSEALAPHIAAGLLRPCAEDRLPAPCPAVTKATKEWDATARVRTPPLLWIRTGAHILAAERELRSRALGDILKELEQNKHQGSALSDEEARHHAGAVCRAFRCWNMVMSPLDHCLPRSIALMRMLAPCQPRLVLAVMARPFRAHCWVQLDDLLLNDSLAHIGGFTPIRIF